jgi:hypothetical protein
VKRKGRNLQGVLCWLCQFSSGFDILVRLDPCSSTMIAVRKVPPARAMTTTPNTDISVKLRFPQTRQLASAPVSRSTHGVRKTFLQSSSFLSKISYPLAALASFMRCEINDVGLQLAIFNKFEAFRQILLDMRLAHCQRPRRNGKKKGSRPTAATRHKTALPTAVWVSFLAV